MPELPVKNLSNQDVSKLNLVDAVFDYPSKPFLVHEAVCHHLAKGRAGTHATKTRKEVSGGGRKPWRQKKTGRSRHGSIRSPLWRGGGAVHGPQPRSYDYSFPRRKRWNALRSVLSQKLREGNLMVVENLAVKSPRTKDLVMSLKTLGLADTKILLLDLEPSRELGLAARNLPRVDTAAAMGLTAYDALNHDVLVASVVAVERLQEWLQP